MKIMAYILNCQLRHWSVNKVSPEGKILKIVPLKFFDPSAEHFEVESNDLPISKK